MTSNGSASPKPATPVGADDFKRIRGIGPSIARRLYQGGILFFAQLAVQSPAEVAALVADIAGLSAEQIAKKEWIGQARALAGGDAQAPQHDSVVDMAALEPNQDVVAQARQHYATFTVELLLDEHNNVRRTRLTYVQERAEDTWAGWHAARLVDFVVQRAGVHIPAVEAAHAAVEIARPVEAASRRPLVQVHALEPVPAQAGGPSNFLPCDQPFDVRLTLDLADLAAPAGEPLAYTATIYAKSLHDRSRQAVGEACGTLIAADTSTLQVSGAELPRGMYRLEAAVTIKDLATFQEGGLFQVY